LLQAGITAAVGEDTDGVIRLNGVAARDAEAIVFPAPRVREIGDELGIADMEALSVRRFVV